MLYSVYDLYAVTYVTAFIVFSYAHTYCMIEEQHLSLSASLCTDCPVCPQLAKAGSHTFTVKSFKRRQTCDVCKQSIDSPAAFCKGESAVHSGQVARPDAQLTRNDTHNCLCPIPLVLKCAPVCSLFTECKVAVHKTCEAKVSRTLPL